jgi:hypothetical protein
MSHILRMATVGVMLAFAATGAAQARGNFDRGGFGSVFDQSQAGYAGPVYSSTSSVRKPVEFVLGRGMTGVACDMPSSTSSNDERIND